MALTPVAIGEAMALVETLNGTPTAMDYGNDGVDDITASNFDRFYARSTLGGPDVATLYGSAVSDRFFVPHESVALALSAAEVAGTLAASGAEVRRNGSRGLLWAEPMIEIERDGTLIMVDDHRLPIEEGEIPQMRKVRFRTLGCYPLTGAVESEAKTLPEIIQEMLLTTTSERQGRIIDNDQSGMEDKKKEGYF